jgi:hypothetical protein
VIGRGSGGSTFYEQSLYKHGWSLFKQAQNEVSLKSFVQVLDLKLRDRGNAGATRSFDALSRADRELAEDTLRVMSIAFSYPEGAQSVDELLGSRGSVPYAWLLYSRLGDLYVEKQRIRTQPVPIALRGSRPGRRACAIAVQSGDPAYEKGGFWSWWWSARPNTSIPMASASRSGTAANAAGLQWLAS